MLKLTCVVDHVTLSPLLKGEHGLSMWIECGEQVVLFDTGQTSEVLLHNLAVLDLKPECINAVVLSHAHYDHTGGLLALVERSGNIPVFANADLFRSRYSFKNGLYQFVGLSLNEGFSRERVQLNDEPVEVIPGLWTSGRITTRDEPIGKSPHHYVRSTEGGWLPDPYLDDLSLVYQGEGGLTLICGCCHAGVLNTIAHVEKRFDQKVTKLVGGIHLAPASADELERVMRVLREQYPGMTYYLNHCTGSKAVIAFENAFPGKVNYLRAGVSISSE